jgi:hypothetical protein
LLGPDAGIRNAAEDLLRRGDDVLFVCEERADLRLPAFCGPIPKSTARERRAAGGGQSTYKPWHNKQTGKTYLRPDDGKCLHYYFYFIDEELGLG